MTNTMTPAPARKCHHAFDVLVITTAYESGFGHGQNLDGLPNPYAEDSPEHHAYSIGYEEGERRRRDNGSSGYKSDDILLDEARDILFKSSIRVEGNEQFILRLMKAHARSSQPPRVICKSCSQEYALSERHKCPGLQPAPPPTVAPSLEDKLATMVWYLEEVRRNRRSQDLEAFNSYLDDPEVALWLDKMMHANRVKNTRFTERLVR